MAALDGVALVIGGAGGIGSECGFSIAAAGAKLVVFADIDEAAAKEVAETSKKWATNPEYRALAFKVDITKLESLERLIEFTIKEGGRIDYAVNSAGVEPQSYKSVGTIDVDDYDRVMEINGKGMFLSMRVQLNAMEKQEPRTIKTRKGTRDIGRGAIVNIASAHSFVPVPYKVSYISAKHADMGLLKSAVVEYAAKGIRVNSLCPTFVWTRMVEEEIKHDDTSLKVVEAVVPIKRMAEAQEVGDTAAWLCGPQATYINGVSLMMDAGCLLSLRLN